MISFSLRSVAAAGAALVFSASVFAQTAIIQKARAYLGTETALENVKSIHFTGTITSADPADAKKQITSAIDIIFQKPDQHRIVTKTPKIVETYALDGYEAWQRVEDIADPSKFRQVVLGAETVRRLRANTWQSLYWYRGIEKVGGRIEVGEPTTIDGVACQRVAFVHGPNIIYVRCFDQNTGRLVLTETETGATIKEEGEITVEGIRFPKSIITRSKAGAPKPTVVTITFEKITLNENFPASIFTYSLGGK